MAEVQEYEYGPQHLEDSDALERFSQEKARHPDAVVTLNEEACGRWSVITYKTDAEKERMSRRRLLDLVDAFLGSFLR